MTNEDKTGTLVISFSKESLDKIENKYGKIIEGSQSSTCHSL